VETLDVVVGAQFGSEAKGHVAQQVIRRRINDTGGCATAVCVRVGGPNAGHTVVDRSGVAWALRQVPVGVVEEGVALVIAAGSEIDPPVLLKEIDDLEAGGHRIRDRLVVDHEATVLLPVHRAQEVELVKRIGSTGKGIGEARVDRLRRTALRVADHKDLIVELFDRGVQIVDTARFIYQHRLVVIEGTQGYGLGLHAGYDPKCTSADCRAIDVLAQAGVNPWSVTRGNLRVWLAVRPYPIRVAGESGPLLGETTWGELGLPAEVTTVTKKTRRVARWDGHLVLAAVLANGGGTGWSGPVRLAFTMADQVAHEIKGSTSAAEVLQFGAVKDWVTRIQNETATNIKLITTSPSTAVWV
jgi:adenylosuccinate synthase